jgi:hypothetical protein
MTQVDDLDAVFAAAAAQRVTPSADLYARILADADVNQPKPVSPPVTSAPPQGWFRTLSDWFGGGLSLAGMSAAALAGLYLGVAQPVQVLALTELVTGTTTIDSLDLLPSAGTFWAQE